MLVNRHGVLPISRVGCCLNGGWFAEYGSGRFLGGVVGGGFVVAGDTEASPAANFAAAEVEAVGADSVLPLADDLSEGGASLAFCPSAHAEVVAAVLKLGEEGADTIGELFASSDVDGALAAGDAVGNPEVGAVAGGAACAVGCDDGAALGEDFGVVLDEVDGGHRSDSECEELGG